MHLNLKNLISWAKFTLNLVDFLINIEFIEV